MKKLLSILFVLLSFASFGQTIRVLQGYNPTTMQMGVIYRDTTIALPYTAGKYITGFATVGSLPDSVRAAISLTTIGSTGASTYNSATGVFNIPSYAGGGGGAAGSSTWVQYNNSSAFGADSAFRWKITGANTTQNQHVYSGLYIIPTPTAQAQNDTLVTLNLTSKYSDNGFTGVKKYDIKLGVNYIKLDSLYNYSLGNGNTSQPASGNTNFFGFQAGSGATNASFSNFLGYNAGVNATNASYANFFGNQAGSGASGAQYSNFFGYLAGNNASGSTSSNFFGTQAGSNVNNGANSNFFGNSSGNSATNANNSNFFGSQAGSGATNANNSNFFGNYAGGGATGAQYSNFFGNGAGNSVTGASYSNFFGLNSGSQATNANNSNFFGNSSGYLSSAAPNSNFFGGSSGSQATNANNSNFFGQNTGKGAVSANNSNFFGTGAGLFATGASYSNFFGFQTGDSLTFKITGTNNIIIGTNITLPTASTANSINIGNVLYGTNTYSTITGNPSATAQTTGQIGINITTPVASAALDITSTTAGFLPPRMTATQASAISSPAEGLLVYVTNTSGTFTAKGWWGYDGAAWQKLNN
jgi:hypothetical protein